jgi:hypothetical protein
MRTLEFKDVQDFSVTETRREGAVYLRISGLAFHSALAVDHIETFTTGDTLVVKALLIRARKGKSGRFEHVVEVSPAIRRVVFGDDRHQIWPK